MLEGSESCNSPNPLGLQTWPFSLAFVSLALTEDLAEVSLRQTPFRVMLAFLKACPTALSGDETCNRILAPVWSGLGRTNSVKGETKLFAKGAGRSDCYVPVGTRTACPSGYSLHGGAKECAGERHWPHQEAQQRLFPVDR